jgi:hypothetical protein
MAKKKPTLKEQFIDHFSGAPRTFEEIWTFFEPHLKKKESAPKREIPEDKLIDFNEMFPKLKAGSGKMMRCNLRELEKAFQYFFKEYGEAYDWDTILSAANVYINEQERDSFKYARTAKYFVIKFKQPGMPESMLAEYCVQILEGTYFNQQNEPSQGFEPKIK